MLRVWFLIMIFRSRGLSVRETFSFSLALWEGNNILDSYGITLYCSSIMKNETFPKTLLEAIKYFGNPDTALGCMVAIRWPDGIECPRCEAREYSFVKTRRIWICKGCKKHFSVKIGTIMEDSPIGLDKWLSAIW